MNEESLRWSAHKNGAACREEILSPIKMTALRSTDLSTRENLVKDQRDNSIAAVEAFLLELGTDNTQLKGNHFLLDVGFEWQDFLRGFLEIPFEQ